MIKRSIRFACLFVLLAGAASLASAQQPSPTPGWVDMGDYSKTTTLADPGRCQFRIALKSGPGGVFQYSNLDTVKGFQLKSPKCLPPQSLRIIERVTSSQNTSEKITLATTTCWNEGELELSHLLDITEFNSFFSAGILPYDSKAQKFEALTKEGKISNAIRMSFRITNSLGVSGAQNVVSTYIVLRIDSAPAALKDVGFIEFPIFGMSSDKYSIQQLCY